MGDPIDIKTKQIINPKDISTFKRTEVFSNLEENITKRWGAWGKFQQRWCSQSFKAYKDYDKFLVWMYLNSKAYTNLSHKFVYQSLEEFYKDSVKIDKVNLIEISEYLNIPKETIRRKINEFQEEGVLLRKGKEIMLLRESDFIERPEEAIGYLSIYIEKTIVSLRELEWFNYKINKEKIEIFIKKNFSMFWQMFYNLQLPYLIRHRKLFGDLETWNIWGIIALNHQTCLQKKLDKDMKISYEDVNVNNYFNTILDQKPSYGINASSISDISTIPRATVIRKLKWLTANKMTKKDKNLEYSMMKQGKLNKQISINFIINQTEVCKFVTDILELMLNSKFSINE